MHNEEALKVIERECEKCKGVANFTKEECDDCVYPIVIDCIRKREEEICSNCRHFKEVRQMIEKQWHTFHICDFLMDCEKGYGIVVVPNDMCECFVKEVEND